MMEKKWVENFIERRGLQPIPRHKSKINAIIVKEFKNLNIFTDSDETYALALCY